MKKVLKQILSVLLAVVMTFTITLPAFAQESEEPQANTQTEVDYESTNAIGSLILDNVEQETSEEENADYLIQSVIIENKAATVELKNLNACTVVVAIYENNGGKMLASGKTDVEAKESVADDTVTVEIETEEMPEYFYVKAFLVDVENKPLCKSYESVEYTKEFEEFMAKTTDDFDSDKVINLDESEDNNFLVVSDDATVIAPEEGKNIVAKDDYENGIYVIENADEQIKGLKKGDVFYYQYGEGENDYIIIKIEDINVDGDTVTLFASEIDEISELFQYIKIDETTTQTTFDASGMAEGVTHESMEISTMRHDVNIDTSVSVVEKWSIDIELTDNIEFGAGIEGTFGAGLKFFYDFYLFDSDYHYFELTIFSSVAVSVYVSGKMDSTIPLGKVGFNFFGAVTAKADFSFIFEAEAELELSFTIAESVIGASYDNINGLVNKTTSSEAEFDNELSFEITFFAGFEIKPEVKVFKYAEMSLSAKTGLEATITEPVPDPAFAIHDCGACLDIKLDFVASLSMKIKILEIINKSTTFASFKENILTAYYSNDIGFGEGKCPNISYAVNIYVTDETKAPLSDVVINNEIKTDSNGKTVIYLPNGNHTITTQFQNGEVRTEEVTIIDCSTSVNFSLNASGVYASGVSGNLKWYIYSDGELVLSGVGDMQNYKSEKWSMTSYGTSAPWADFKKTFKKVTVREGITSIGSYAFYNLDFESISLPFSLVTIESCSFMEVEKLKVIYFPDSLEEIKSSAFSESTVSTIVFGENLREIGSYAFSNSNADTLYFGKNIQKIGDYAFDKFLGAVGAIYYEGTQAEWYAIDIGVGSHIGTTPIYYNYPLPKKTEMYAVSLNLVDEYSTLESKTNKFAVVKGNDYIMVAVKDENAEDLLAPSNLLYIDQKTAESEELTFEYVIDESITDYDVLVFGQKLPHYHLYDETITTSPTCTEKGVKTFTCECGDSYTEEIEMLDHEYESAVTAPTCTEKGFTTYICECGDTYVADYVDETGHSHTSEITTPATHIKEGVMTFVCSCGDTYTETVARIPGHTYETVVTAPTCTEQGYTIYTCSCGDSYVDDYVDATSHNDTDSDGCCDECGEDLTVNCSHSCHSSGFVNFFWKIINFLQKLFGVQSARYCECGVDHWSK